MFNRRENRELRHLRAENARLRVANDELLARLMFVLEKPYPTDAVRVPVTVVPDRPDPFTFDPDEEPE